MKSLGHPVKMLRIRMNGDGELEGGPANPGLPGKWPLKQCVCVCVQSNKAFTYTPPVAIE